MSATIIADAIHWDGYVVGRLADAGVPATAMADFVDHLENGTLHEDEDDQEPISTKEEDEVYEGAMEDVLRSMKPFSVGGLIKYADLERIVAQLKEEGAHEAAVS